MGFLLYVFVIRALFRWGNGASSLSPIDFLQSPTALILTSPLSLPGQCKVSHYLWEFEKLASFISNLSTAREFPNGVVGLSILAQLTDSPYRKSSFGFISGHLDKVGGMFQQLTQFIHFTTLYFYCLEFGCFYFSFWFVIVGRQPVVREKS